MANITDVCNMALAYLGKPKIASVDEDSEPARQCKMFYPIAKRKLLRDYDWGFAKKVEPLGQLSYEHPRWSYVYAYPNKCVRAMKIYYVEPDQSNGQQGVTVADLVVDFEKDPELFELYMANDNTVALGCNIPNAYIEYIYDADDAAVFPSDFFEALCHMLAFHIAIQLTGSMDMKNAEFQLAERCVSSAKYHSSMERNREPEYPDKYFRARY